MFRSRGQQHLLQRVQRRPQQLPVRGAGELQPRPGQLLLHQERLLESGGRYRPAQMTEQQQDQPDRAREPVREQQGDGREGPPGGLRPQHPLRDGGRAGEGEAGEAPGAGVGQEGLDQGAGHSEWRPARVLVPPVEGRAGQADPGRERGRRLGHRVQALPRPPRRPRLRPGERGPGEDQQAADQTLRER